MAGRVWMWLWGEAGIGTDSGSAFGDCQGLFPKASRLSLQDYCLSVWSMGFQMPWETEQERPC